MTKNLARIWSDALLGQRSNSILLGIVINDRKKDKRSNVNEVNLLQKKVIICGMHSPLEEAIAFCCRLFTE